MTTPTKFSGSPITTSAARARIGSSGIRIIPQHWHTEEFRVIQMYTAAERPDLWARGIASSDVWPEYNLHGDVASKWWQTLEDELPDYQFVLFDEQADEVVAEGHSGPFSWNGEVATL